MTKTITREWTCYYNEDGEPWAIFVDGHVDLRTIRSNACKAEMRDAFDRAGLDDYQHYFANNLNIGHWWIRDAYSEDDEDANPDHPWHWCEKGDAGAIPITGAKF